jgi:hypothetical protein
MDAGQEGGVDALEQAKLLIRQEKEERATKCLKELQMVLAEFNCTWGVHNKLTDNNVIQSVIVITPNDK